MTTPEPPDVPAGLASSPGSIPLALIAALQLLTPRERAVLVLREILRWPAGDVAALLETSVASINSALDLARSTVASIATDSIDDDQRKLLARYVDAFENYDLDPLTPPL